jgi:subtilisin family serine protease
MIAGRSLLPWAPRSGAYALPTSILVRLALGEMPDAIPSEIDVRRGAAQPADKTGIGPIDRIVAAFGGGVRVARVHAAAAGLRNPGGRHLGFDDDEQISGVARMLRFDVEPGTYIGSLGISLLQLGMVEAATPNYLCTVGMDGSDRPGPVPRAGPAGEPDSWQSREMINAVEALAYEPGDPAVIVGVVDSGIATVHAEFGRQIRSGYDTVRLGSSEMAGGVTLLGDRSGTDTNPADRFVGHGSGCAAIIGALGEAMPPGLAGDAQILPIRSLGAARFPGRTAAVGIGAIGDLDMGVKMAVDLGARIINMSFGTDDEALEPGAAKPHAESVAYAAARGCTLVAASGNSGDARTYWPACFPEVIAVGACDPGYRPCSFSTTGPQVALNAPGERVVTAALEGYQHATGTSFAAPFVAGAAALLLARAERRSCPLDPETLRHLLVSSSRPHDPGTAEGNGAGTLDVTAALRALDRLLDTDESTELGGEDDD